VNGPVSSAHLETNSVPRPTREITQWVTFHLDDGRYALPLAAVERIIRAVYVTQVPLAPSVVLGAIDIEGRIVPVLSVRRRLGLAERPIDPASQFLIAQTRWRRVALLIDAVETVIECPRAAIAEATLIAPQLEYIRGIIHLTDGLVLIQDLERLLSADEARGLDDALIQDGPRVL